MIVIVSVRGGAGDYAATLNHLRRLLPCVNDITKLKAVEADIKCDSAMLEVRLLSS